MAIDAVVEEVATNLEEVAEVTRRINTNSVAFFLGGTAFGFALGFYWGYKFNKEKIKAEAFRESKEEVEKIRETYRLKTLAAAPKPSAEEVVEEKGYSQERPTKPPVPVYEPPVVTVEPTIVVVPEPEEKVEDYGEWDYQKEMATRNDEDPFVIHQDEWSENSPNNTKVAYTYYAIDDVMLDDSDRPLPHGDLVVGQNNLKFGYGTDDPDVVFVRNPRLGLDMEICRLNESYEIEVLGLGAEEPDETD